MRILAVLVLAMALAASPGFAQGQQAAVKALSQAPEEITGTVDSINPIDPARGADEGSIFVRDDAGNAPMIIIDAETAILDASSKNITSADIEDGSRVKVVYKTSDAGKKALTISVLAK